MSQWIMNYLTYIIVKFMLFIILFDKIMNYLIMTAAKFVSISEIYLQFQF